jgi:pimeloyl-ACP methyl ester carboxylesterase
VLRRRLALVATVSIATLLLGGCASLKDLANGASLSAPTGESVAAPLKPYYSQVLKWTDCGMDQQCTRVRAPMNWDAPSKATDITLALTRHLSSGKPLGALFVNPGGPGGSGFDLVHDDLDFAVSEKLSRRFDVIGWDPRGVGRSAPVTCYDDKHLDHYLYDVPAAAVNSPAWVAEVTRSATDFGQACLKNTGEVLKYVDTQSTVHDLDLMRSVVGASKLDYLGYSYGSDIGMYYIDRYPDRVGHVVLDGATDSTIGSFEVGLEQNRAFELALRHYMEDCLTTTRCPFGPDVDAGLSAIAAQYDALTLHPIAAKDGRLADGNLLDTAISSALYDQSSWPDLSSMFRKLKKGDVRPAFELADSYNGRDEDGSYGDNSLEAFLAISCLDYPVTSDPAEIARQSALAVAAAPTLTRPSVVGDVVCRNWPFANRTPPKPVTGAGAPPVLILSSTGDPATPYQWGVALSKQLQSAHLITRKGEGHTAFNRGIPCVDDAVDDYFVSGLVPVSDPGCKG